jgi:hypothetical protein
MVNHGLHSRLKRCEESVGVRGLQPGEASFCCFYDADKNLVDENGERVVPYPEHCLRVFVLNDILRDELRVRNSHEPYFTIYNKARELAASRRSTCG